MPPVPKTPAFKMTKVNLTRAAANTNDPSMLAELEGRYDQLRRLQAEAVKSSRIATKAQAQAEIDARKLHMEFSDFMIYASDLDKVVATESVWPTPPFRNDTGDIILETPFSTRDARIAGRIMHSEMADKAKGISDRFSGLFEQEESTGQDEE